MLDVQLTQRNTSLRSQSDMNLDRLEVHSPQTNTPPPQKKPTKKQKRSEYNQNNWGGGVNKQQIEISRACYGKFQSKDYNMNFAVQHKGHIVHAPTSNLRVVKAHYGVGNHSYSSKLHYYSILMSYAYNLDIFC